MADHIQKKAKYEEAQDDEVPSLEPDTAAPSEVAGLKFLHDPSLEEEERTRMSTTSINYMNILRSREICNTGNSSRKVPNIFRDYHLQVYRHSMINDFALDFVIAGDIIFVIHESCCISPFRRDGGFSWLTYEDEDGLKRMNISIKMHIEYACYNSNNNSLIVVGTKWMQAECASILSFEIEPIKAGLRTQHTTICAQDGNMIRGWDLDIPNCRGMVYNIEKRLFKVFELKKYTLLFTIPREADDSFRSDLRFGSPGNTDLFVMMYNKNLAAEEILLRIYSKHSGELRKRISIPVYPQHSIDNVELCGTDRILLQQSQLGVQILDISGQISKAIKTDIEIVGCPYYLCKRNLFICHTQRRGVTGLHVFNLQGEIVVTFQDHQLLCEPGHCLLGSHIPTAEDIVISICRDKENMQDDAKESGLLTVNVSSILTGTCIGKITASPSNCSDDRKSALRALLHFSLAYNETTHEIFTAGPQGDICIWSNKFYNDFAYDHEDDSSVEEDFDNYNDSSVEEEDDDFDNYNDSSVEEEDDNDSSAEEEEF